MTKARGLGRRACPFVVAILCLLSLCACVDTRGRVYRTEPPVAPAALSLLTDEPEAARPLSEAAVAYHRNHPHSEIQISLLSDEINYFTLLRSKFAVGDSPDLMLSQPSSNVDLYATGGYLLDLTNTGLASRSDEGTGGAPGIRSFALPLEVDAGGLLVNLSLLRRLGIDEPPKTAEDFFADCAAMRGDGVEDPVVLYGSDGTGLLRFVRQYLLENAYARDRLFYLRIVDGKSSWDNGAVRSALAAFAKLRSFANADALLIGRYEALRRLGSGQAAFSIDGTDAIPFLGRTAPQLSFELVAAPWGRPADNRLLSGVGSVIYASNSTRDRAEVVDFLRSFTAVESVLPYSRAVGGIPALPGTGARFDSRVADSVRLASSNASEWGPTDQWVPGFDLVFGHILQQWYAGASDEWALSALDVSHRAALRADPDFGRRLLAASPGQDQRTE